MHACDRQSLDVTDPAANVFALDAGAYTAAINTATYTANDRYESEIAATRRLNALTAALIATETIRRNIPLAHVSTDYVFDGSSQAIYAPDASVNPQIVYGASKAAARTGTVRCTIMHTAWVVSPHRANLVETMLRLDNERDRLSVVDDQQGYPTSAADALGGTALQRADDPAAPTGTSHCLTASATPLCGFARATKTGIESRGARGVPLESIPTSSYAAPAARLADSEHSTETLRCDFCLMLWPSPPAGDETSHV